MPQKPRAKPLLLCSLLAAGVAGCGDCAGGPGLQRARLELEVSPQAITFPPTWAGLEAQAAVTLHNSGNAAVRLTAVDLGATNVFVLAGRPPAAVEAGETVQLQLIFRPESDGPQQATLRVTNTSDNLPMALVQLEGLGRLIPLCDDHNACTADFFDVPAERCVFEPRDGTCDDDNACTDGDRCVEGACRGVGRRCDDFNICTTDACDPQRGCLNPPDTQRCADMDPCTADLCDPVNGCGHVPAPDGTPCAPVNGCTALFLCASGVCTSYPVPDNFPCFDGDICSVGDRCVMGTCMGQRDPSPPEVAQVLPTFGGVTARNAILDDNRVLFLDGELDPPGALGDLWAAPQKPVLTSVTFGGGALVAGQHLILPQPSRTLGPVVVLDASHVAVFTSNQVDTHHSHILQLGQDGQWAVQASVAYLPPHGAPHRAVSLDGILYGCHPSGVSGVDAREPAAAFLSLFGAQGSCTDILLVPAHGASAGRVLALVAGGTAARPGGPAWVELGLQAGIPAVLRDVADLPTVAVRESDANTTLVALHIAADPSRTGGTQIQLRQADTLQLLATLQLDSSVERAVGLCLDGNHLVTMRYDNDLTRPRLVVLDVMDPRAPAVVSTRVLVPTPDASFIAVQEVLDQGARVQCEHGVVVAGSLVYRLGNGGTLEPWTSPEHGAVRELVQLGAELHAVHRGATRRVVVPSAGPARLEGLGIMEVVAQAVRVGGGPFRDVFPGYSFAGISHDPLVSFLFDGAIWAQAQPTTPAPVRRLEMDGTGRAARAAGDVLWTAPLNTTALVVERTQLNIPWSTTPYQFVPDVSLELANVPGISSTVPVLMAVTADGNRLVAAPVLSPQTDLVVVEHSGGPLRELARGSLPAVPDGPPLSAALWNDTLLVVRAPPEVISDGVGGVVELFQVDTVNHTLQPAARLELPGAMRILVFDGINAVLATFGGITFLQALGTQLRVLGNVAVPALVTDAKVYEDRLILAGENGVVVVSPPCPPP